jgi:hypothetical protein
VISTWSTQTAAKTSGNTTVDKAKVLRLHRELFETVLTVQKKESPTNPDEIDPFSFLASRSLRGDTCGEYACRIRKLDFLGCYAALYANRVILPLYLSRPSSALLVSSFKHG